MSSFGAEQRHYCGITHYGTALHTVIVRTFNMRPVLASLGLLVGLALPVAPSASAQFVHTLGASGFDEGVDVALDANGNATFIGTFRGSLDFDPGPGSVVMTSAATDVYVASYDATGALRFAFPIGNVFATSEAAGGIGLDASGGFAITGSQPFNSIDYDPDSTQTAIRTGRLFVASYDQVGGFRFAVTPTGPANANGSGTAVAFDGAGNAYVTGHLDGPIAFNPEDTTSVSSRGSTDIFLASYDTSGAYRFAFSLGGTSEDQGLDIVIDAAANVYITGFFNDAAAFDPTDSDGDGDVNALQAAGGPDAFLASYTSDGTFRFARSIGGSGADAGRSLDVDDLGNVYVAGSFGESVEFDADDSNEDGNPASRTASGNGSAFLASYSSENEFRFVSVPGGGQTTANGISTLGSGISFMTGSFTGAVDFDPGPQTDSVVSGAGSDVFVVTYGNTGIYRGVMAFGGSGLNAARGIDVDETGTTVLTGSFSGTTDFDPGPGLDERTGAGQTDLFMARYPAFGKPVSTSTNSTIDVAITVAPNPFREQATIRLEVGRMERVVVSAYDLLGRRVAVLFDEVVPTRQERRIAFDASTLAAGPYLIHFEGETFRSTRLVIRTR